MIERLSDWEIAMKKKKHNYRREAVLETVRRMEAIMSGLFEVLGDEVVDEVSKANVFHFHRGARFVIRNLRNP